MNTSIPICDYEGSRYAVEFWSRERRYEDLAERVALKKILPPGGKRLIEIGAGAGRLADLYAGYEEVILTDYARSVLKEAHQRWGSDARFRFVEADVYRLPFVPGAFDAVVMVRVMHHLAEVEQALAQVVSVLREEATLVIEYANKCHLKAIARWLLRRQAWSPFDRQPYEFARLNFDFHPAWMTGRLRQAGLSITRELGVSYFRMDWLKRAVAPHLLAAADGLLQGSARWWKVSPSVFVQARLAPGASDRPAETVSDQLFKCPACGTALVESKPVIVCPRCRQSYPLVDGVYVFK
ncbi:MAG: methyltransferase domain-containing protein [Thermoflexales bacterium]|nr:methyltransferase domain-containing protein [Thermoflexales bacterium]